MSQFSEMIKDMSKEIHKYIRKCIKSASFDKSKSARITQVLDNNEYVVTMSDGAVKTVPSLSSDSFNVNDVVRVTVAQNDSKNCYIVGKPNIPKGSSGGAVTSVNGQTGIVVLDADDISDTSTTNKFVTSADKTKLSNLSGVNTGDQDLSVKADRYVTGTTYPAGTSVVHNGCLWVNTSGTSTTGVEPGTNYNIWNVTYCNPHIEDNWDFCNPINQRGQTNYTSGYTIDRWFASGSGISEISLSSGNGIILTSNSGGYCGIGQWIENWSDLTNIYTISIKISNGTIYTITDCFGSSTKDATFGNNLYVQYGYFSSKYGFLIFSPPSTTTTVSAVKLELGSVSTLANDPPADYGEELRKCQRYYEITYFEGGDPTSTGVFDMTVAFKSTKRVAPSNIVYSKNGTEGKVSVYNFTSSVWSEYPIIIAGSPYETEDGGKYGVRVFATGLPGGSDIGAVTFKVVSISDL